MIEIRDKRLCSGCTACASICPVNCISMERDAEGFLYPVVDKSRCIGCGLCERICPILNKKKDEKIAPKAYAAINNDLSVRMNSSSGGVFSLLADYVLDNGGVVFGASFDEKFNVRHTYIERKEDLQKLRVSKYVQSYMGNSFKKAKEFLESGRLVLFTGTGCQIGGLKSYLRKDYDNLFTQDLICHGVPSPLVWEKYIAYRGDGKSFKEISFRKKSEEKKKASFYIKYSDGAIYQRCPYPADPMVKMFLMNKCLRPCCYECAFKTITRQSDITLADFWGINTVYPKINDGKGVSLILVHTDKGRKLVDAIKEKMTYKEVPFKSAVRFNKMYYKCAFKNPIRKKFFSDLKKLPFEKMISRYGWGLL